MQKRADFQIICVPTCTYKLQWILDLIGGSTSWLCPLCPLNLLMQLQIGIHKINVQMYSTCSLPEFPYIVVIRNEQ